MRLRGDGGGGGGGGAGAGVGVGVGAGAGGEEAVAPADEDADTGSWKGAARAAPRALCPLGGLMLFVHNRMTLFESYLSMVNVLGEGGQSIDGEGLDVRVVFIVGAEEIGAGALG